MIVRIPVGKVNVLRKIEFVVLFIIISQAFVLGQSTNYQFGRIDMSKGLSHPNVYDIAQDSTGFMWFATSSGLNRYDGYSIKVFRNIPGDSNSLHVDLLTKIFEGPEGRLWFMSLAGNIAYDPKTENFIRNTDDLLRKYSVAHGVITYLKKDKFGRFWFAHYNQGLYCYDPRAKNTVRLTPIEGDSSSISSTELSSLMEDKTGNMWVIHQNGVFEKIDYVTLKVTYRNTTLRDRHNGQLQEYYMFIDNDDDIWVYMHRDVGCYYFNIKDRIITRLHTQATRGRLSSNIVSSVQQGNDSLIWIGTENGGVNILDKRDFSVRYVFSDEADAKSLSENTVRLIYKDRQGILWLGSYKNGISYYHPNLFRFQLIKHEVGKPQSLPYNDINAFAEDKSGNIWIGTNGGGLIYFDRKKNSFKQYLHNPNDSYSLSNNVIVSLLVDHDNILWIGTYYGGLNRFDGQRFTHYLNSPGNPKSLGDNSIWEIYEDADYNLWLGTLRGGLDVFNRTKNEFIHYKSGEINSIHTTYVPDVIQDRAGNMWVATGFGLEVLQKKTGRFIQYMNIPEQPTSISSNSVQCVFEDSRGWIWIGTNGGLNRFNPNTSDFTDFGEQDGLAHNSILTLTEDNEHNIWMSTPKGLTRLSVSKENEFLFQNYDATDGLIQGVYHERAVLKCKSGELVFGGSSGLNIFNPSQITTDVTVPALVLTDLQVSNKSIGINQEINGKVILSSPLNQLKGIVLGPDHSFFSIDFAALNFLHPDKSLYKYKLEGFNEAWISARADQRRVTFTNLDPGTYTFRVKASNSDGVWGENEAALIITIKPPFWKSNIAFVIYATFILGALLLGRRLVVVRERLKFSIQTERNSAQKMHELDMMKIKFFTNVGHELRTPLTLIITPLEKLLKNAHSPEEEKQFNLIHRNARRLLNLVNQLLDFKRMEGDELNLNMSEGDIVQFIRDLVWSFSDLSDKKNIHLSFNTSVGSQEIFFDMDKVEKIMFNLLSNAFKFTPDHGHVTVDLKVVSDKKAKYLVIKVSDTGIGIPADKHDKIFERFYQHELPPQMVNQGSGIGLSITQEFVKLHGGTIEVDSQPGKGSAFIVMLPIHDIHKEQVVQNDHLLSESEVIEEGTDTGKPLLMLVDDHEDFRSYLRDNLRSQYTIIEAANGKLAFEKAVSVVPDLIVSDVMMPEWNGVELCKHIKADNRTSHVPVILLTARTAQEQQLEGFQSGANDYITKPFSFEILESRIQNVLKLRSIGHKQFQKHLDIKVSEIEVASVDEKLVRDAVKLVEDNLTNSDFSVEELSRMLGMSRVHLYKKLYSLTGKTPIEFIRFIRIQRAAQLLEKSDLNVSEVAYQVGFNHPKYFARYFRDVHNMLPSEYAALHRQKRQGASKEF